VILIEEQGLEETIRALQRLSPAARRAANRAVRKTVTWAYGSIIRQGAAAADINQAALRRSIRFDGKRVYRRDVSVKRQDSEASVYTGYNPLKSHYVGKIRKWRRGQIPSVRRHRFPGSFVLTFRNGYRGIFKRDPISGKLVEEKVDLEAVNQVVRTVRRQSRSYLKGVLATELEIEIKKRGSR
jgi:hypothetical protein